MECRSTEECQRLIHRTCAPGWDVLNRNVDGRADLAVVTTNVRWYNDSPDGEEPAGTAKQMIFLCKDSGRRWLVRTVIYNSDSLT